MTIEDNFRDEKLQYDIIIEAAKISALSSGKIDKYDYLAGEEILPFDQKQVIEQAKFTYYLLGKAFKKQTKTAEDQGTCLKNGYDTKIKLVLKEKEIYDKMLLKEGMK